LQERDALFAAALQLEDTGQHDEALKRYAELLAADAGRADAWHNRGLLLARLGRLQEAEQSHRAFVAAFPDSWRAHSDLSDVLLALERYDEALTEAQQAVDYGPGSFLPYFTAGLASTMQKQFAEARRWIDAARQFDPAGLQRLLARNVVPGALDRDFDPRAIYLIREFDRLEVCDWTRYGELVEEFRAAIETGESEKWPLRAPPLVFRSFHLPLGLESLRTLADNVARYFAEVTAPARLSATTQSVRRDGRIRIGYLSADFRTHPTAILGAPVFRLHDRAKFEVHVFSLTAPDNGPWSTAIRKDADRVHELAGLPFSEALTHLRGAELDILVDWNGLSTGAVPELVAARAAPVQVSFLAFPGTSGRGLSDYLICDRTCVPPEESAGYGEQLARLPHTSWICDPEVTIEPGHARAKHQLPDDGIVFLAHHPSRKLAPRIFAEWMAVLKAVPRSVLWLLAEHPLTRENLIREATRAGIRESRLVFAGRVPHAAHRARIALADVAFDTSPCNGGTTTLDALASGVPVVTCPTPGFAGRMAASALHACGLDELVQHDLDGYRDIAIKLATNPELLGAIRERVRKARTDSALFDTKTRVRELESAYMQMHGRVARGEAPASFEVH